MFRKTLFMLVSAVLFLVCSCIDKDYDLANKEITTDVKLEGNKIALPVGSLKPIKLEELINVEEIEGLDKNPDGVYSISLQDDIEDIEVEVDPISFPVAPISYSINDNFEKPNITEVHINGVPDKMILFDAPEINLKTLNDELPVLKSSAGKGVTNETLDVLFEQLKDLVKIDPDFKKTIRINETVEIDTFIKCNFNYSLPYEVETINNIKLSTRNGGTNGTRVQVVVANPKALTDVDKRIDFEIEFPEMFRLEKDPESIEGIQISDDKRRISLSDYKLDGTSASFSFYITELVDVNENISGGVLKIDEEIKYNIKYKAYGDVTVTAETERNDLAFNVDLDVPLAFSDVSGKVKDINVRFDPVPIELKNHFDNLNRIDRVNYIQFDKSRSIIHFETKMSVDWLSGFELKNGYALKLQFPYKLTIDDNISEYNGKGKEVIYDAEEHAFFIYDLKILADEKWDLALDRLTVDQDVVDYNNFVIEGLSVKVCFVDENKKEVDNLVFAGQELGSMVAVFDKLKGKKEAHFTMKSADLVIEDASVHTTEFVSKIEIPEKDKLEFSLNEKVPEGLRIESLESIDFVNPVKINFDLSVAGLEDLENLYVDLKLKVALPSFLKLQTMQNANARMNADIIDDTLSITARHNPSAGNKLSLELLCTKIDFMNEEFGFKGLIPTEQDGEQYISYKSKLDVVGEAVIEAMDFHSQMLDRLGKIKFDVDVELDEIMVKTFHGKFDIDIEDVNDTFDLDLGEGFDFLKDENNTLVLADPQIELVLTNSIGVPLDVEIEIIGKDENNNVIGTSVMSAKTSIHAAEYDEATGNITPKETKLLIVSDNSSKVGFETITIENLKNLLKKIPSSIDLKVVPKINKSVTHHVDISQPLVFSGSYAMSVPLKFEELHFCYNETIDELQGSLGEVMDMFTNVGLKAKLDILNTIPLGLSLTVTPLDVDGKVIEDITIDPIRIDAGLGGDIIDQAEGAENAQKAQNVEFKISSASGDLSVLDKLSLSIEATSNHTTGSVGIKGEQGIKISNIVFEVFGDIEIDLGDISNME